MKIYMFRSVPLYIIRSYSQYTQQWYSQIYFGNETLHVSVSFSVHHQELFTVHSAMIYVIQVCRQLSSSSRIRMELQFHPDPARGTVRNM
jgi:hypothetical protein